MKLKNVINKLGGNFEIDIVDTSRHYYISGESFKTNFSKWNYAEEEWYKKIKNCKVTWLHVTVSEHDQPAIWITIDPSV